MWGCVFCWWAVHHEQHRPAGRVSFVWAGEDDDTTAAEIARLEAEHLGETILCVGWFGEQDEAAHRGGPPENLCGDHSGLGMWSQMLSNTPRSYNIWGR